MAATAESGRAALPLNRAVVLMKEEEAVGRKGGLDCGDGGGSVARMARMRAVPSARSDLVTHATPGPSVLGRRTFRFCGLDGAEAEAGSKKPRYSG